MKEEVKRSIAEVKSILKEVESFQDSRLDLFRRDSRVGVQQAVERTCVRLRKQEELVAKFQEMSVFENLAREKGYCRIAGVDEVGRGPLAGPVLAAVVILPSNVPILGINDSKQLSQKKREELHERILREAVSVGIGIVEAEVIDEINIYQASKLAMVRAVEALLVAPDFLLIDAMNLSVDLPQESLVKGDARSVSIAAASIVAKVARDRLMREYAKKYPEYGFEKHAGYGTKQHLEALQTYGVTPIHRKSFAPVQARLAVNE